jgi:hypothetical protein
VPETTRTSPVPAGVWRRCTVCNTGLIGGTAVAIVERGSGPSRTLYACDPCITRRRIIPLDEQEQIEGDGQLRFRGR